LDDKVLEWETPLPITILAPLRPVSNHQQDCPPLKFAHDDI